MAKSLRVLSWVAVSSEAQAEKESPAEQKRLNAEFVAGISSRFSGYSGEIVAELELHATRSITMLSTAREMYEQYERMYQMITNRNIDAIVCRSRDRLGRTSALIATIEKLCQDNRVVVIPRNSVPSTLDASETRGDSGRKLISAIESTFAETQIDELVRRHREGMRGRASRGAFLSGVPWGWIQVGKSIQADPVAANTIVYAIQSYLNGNSLRDVVRMLNENGHSASRGGSFVFSSVQAILDKAWQYAGYPEVNRYSKKERKYERFDASTSEWPAIVSKEIAEMVDRERKERVSRYKLRRRKYKRLLAGVCVCSMCGEMCMPKSAGTDNPDYYLCCKSGCKGGCALASKLVEALTIAIEDLSNHAIVEDILSGKQGDKNIVLDSEAIISQLSDKVDSLTEQRKKLTRLYLSGVLVDDEYHSLMTQYQIEIESSVRRINEHTDKKSKVEDTEKTRNRLIKLGEIGIKMITGSVEPNEANAWVRRNFRIYVRNNDAEGVEYL